MVTRGSGLVCRTPGRSGDGGYLPLPKRLAGAGRGPFSGTIAAPFPSARRSARDPENRRSPSRRSCSACAACSPPVPPWAPRLSGAGRGRLHDPRLHLHRGRKAAELQDALPHPRHPAPRRRRQGRQRGADPPRHRRQRRQFRHRRRRRDVRRRAFRRRPAARRQEVLHRPARQHRPRKIRQAERRRAREVPAIPLPRHGREPNSACSPKASASTISTW